MVSKFMSQRYEYDQGEMSVKRSANSNRRRYSKTSSITWNVFVVNSILLVVLCVLSFEGCGVRGLAIDVPSESEPVSGSGSDSVLDKSKNLDKELTGSSGVKPELVPNVPGTLFGHDVDGNGITLGNWLDYGTFLVGVTLAGQMWLVALGLVPIYYTLFAVTDPAELQRRSGRSEENSVSNFSSVTSAWNFQRVVKMITLAYETYQQLDMSEMDCQKKLLCELQQGKDIAATTTRTLSNVLLYFDFFKRIPHMEDYREAIKNGQRRISSRSTADHCSTFYAKCKFSITEFNEKYRRLLST